MLVRKFLKCRLTPEAEEIIKKLDWEGDDIYLTSEERKLIVKSLIETERTWEMEP